MTRQLPLGFYLHVPFCAHSCDFCAFYHEAPRKPDIELYFKGVEDDLKSYGTVFDCDTMFWGGGTPGVLKAADLERLGTLCLQYVKTPPKEWTIELAPSTVKPDKAKVLKDLGVTRVSLGVQSFDGALLDAIGRRHKPSVAYRAIECLRAAGFDNMNLDMMFALPGQTFEMWEKDLREALATQPQHVSTYCLTFEEDTALWTKLSEGEIHAKTEAEEADFYKKTWDVLAYHGFHQYEISNFARDGFACQHNLNTWDMQQWIGIGPSASSQYQGRRYTNSYDLKAWAQGYESGNPVWEDEVILSDSLLSSDSLIFGLRMNRGVNLKRLKDRFPKVDYSGVHAIVDRLVGDLLMNQKGDEVFLTNQGRLLTDRIAVEFLDAFEE